MEQNNENRTVKRIVLLSFIAFNLLGGLLTLTNSIEALQEVKVVKKITSEEVFDSIINQKVDYRLTSYDGRFMYDKLVVVDENENIIGKLIFYTNETEVDSFYNSNNSWRKTKMFNNLKDGTFRIKQKE